MGGKVRKNMRLTSSSGARTSSRCTRPKLNVSTMKAKSADKQAAEDQTTSSNDMLERALGAEYSAAKTRQASCAASAQ